MKRNAAAIQIAGTLVSLGWMSVAALATPHATEKQAGAENQGATPSLPVSVLQVTGTTNSFTISAQHADVLSLLKLVFAQSHRQFVPDASVTGDVTFALSGQKFDTVLAAICRQTFLRYEVDKQGIYQFRRDEAALRNLLLKTQAINDVLSDHLRGMGYAVPAPPAGTDDASRSRYMRAVPEGRGGTVNGVPGGFGAAGASSGGFGGGNVNIPRGRGDAASNAPASVADAASAGRRSAASSKDERTGDADFKARQAGRPDSQSGADGTQKPPALNSQRGGAGPSGPAGQTAEPETSALAAGINRDGQLGRRRFLTPDADLADGGQYLAFKKQNSFVSVNTRGEKTPVQDVLTDLSKQAGVPILIDPDVPKGEEFVVSATIPARPLNEMLNILGYYARLEWRWVNGRIYITTTPQLQLYLRGAMLPSPDNGGNIGNGITLMPRRSAAPANPAPQKKSEDTEKPKKDQKNKSD